MTRTKKNKIFICNYCKFIFKRKDHITIHIRNNHELSEDQKQNCVSCTLCDTYFKNKKRLSRHVKDCHVKTTQNNKDEIEDVISNLKILNSQSRPDTLAQAIEATKLDFIPANETQINEDDIISNMNNLNTGSQTDILAQAIGTTKLEFIPNIDINRSASISENGSILFECRLCSYKTQRLSLLKRHIVIHSSAVRFQCSKCSKKIKYFDNLLKHIKYHDRFDNKIRKTSKKKKNKNKNSDIVIDIDKKSRRINVSICSTEISNMSVDDAILNEMIKDIPCDSLPHNLNDIDFLLDDEIKNSTPVSSPKKQPPEKQNNKIQIISNEVVNFGSYNNLKTIRHDHTYAIVENVTNTLESKDYNYYDMNIDNVVEDNGNLLNEVEDEGDPSISYAIPADDYQVIGLEDIDSILQSQSDYFTTNCDDVYYSNDIIAQPTETEKAVELSIPDYDSPLLNCIAMIESDDVLGDTLTESNINNNFMDILQKFNSKINNNQNSLGNFNQTEYIFDNPVSESSPSINETFKIPLPPAPLEEKLEIESPDNTDDVDDFIMKLLSKRTIQIFDEPDIRDFSCDMCRSTFITERNLTDHKTTVHADTPFICDTCGLKYKSKKSLIQHIIGHSKAGRVRCQVCNASLSRRNLRVHMYKHNDLEPYACPVCGKRFRTSSSKRCHIKNYHIKPPPKKPRKSNLMDMIFSADETDSEKSNLSTPQVLLDCAYNLQRQRPIITAKKKIKGYVCSVCRRAFNSKGNLYRHEAMHERETVVCECGASFTNKRTLHSHRMRYHNLRRKKKRLEDTNI